MTSGSSHLAPQQQASTILPISGAASSNLPPPHSSPTRDLYFLIELADLTTIWHFATNLEQGHDGDGAFKFKTDEKEVTERLDISVPAPTRC